MRRKKFNTSIFTIGHSTRTLPELIKILKSYGISEVVDVRTIPKSRANSQFNEPTLKRALIKHKISYKHLKGLGGLRHPSKNSMNTYWRNASFRGFADYMQTKEFHSALKVLIEIANKKSTVIMCAEAVPWRCHRSLIADALKIRGIQITHIFSENNFKEHKLTESVKIGNGLKLFYP